MFLVGFGVTIFIVFVGGLGPAMGWLSDAYIFYPGFIRILSGILCMRTWAAKPPNMLGWGWPGLGWLGRLGWVGLGWAGLGWAGCAGLGWLAGLAGWLGRRARSHITIL